MNLEDRRRLDAIQQGKRVSAQQDRSALLTGILLGIGIVGFIDETVFHQLLQWHNFYWNTDQFGRILSDGLFHIFSTLLLLWGTIRLWRSSLSWTAFNRKIIVAGILMGAGGFNFYDGIVQHAILHLHLVNEHVCVTPLSRSDTILGICRNDIPYEIVWDLVGLIVLSLGWFLWRRWSNSSLSRRPTSTL
ncbi:MAG: DUF2243 domain-containing protein [Ktedonobacteraceae bacterium]